MGQEPAYVFDFDVGTPQTVGQVPATQVVSRVDFDQALPWLWQRAQGEDLMPMGAAIAAPN
jgi:inner membrane protein